MNNTPESVLNHIAELLQETFKGEGGTDAIKKAEASLKEFQAEPVKFVENLLIIITAEKNEEATLAIKNSACIYMSQFIKRQVKGGLKEQQKEAIATKVLDNIFSDNVNFSTKAHLGKALEPIYKLDLKDSIKDSATIYCREKLNQGGLGNYASALSILQSVAFGAQYNPEKVAAYYSVIYPQLVECGGQLVSGVWEEMQKLDKDQTDETMMNVYHGLKVLYTWTTTILTFMRYIFEKDYDKRRKDMSYASIVLSNDGIVEVLQKILVIQIPTEKQLKECIISTCGVENFDQYTNEVKSQVLKIFNRMFTYVFRLKKTLASEKSKFYKFFTENGILGVLQSIFSFCKNDSVNLDRALEIPSLHELLVQCLSFLELACFHQDFYDTFSNFKRQLIIDVCFFFVKTGENEYALFEEQPEEFVLLSTDTCDKQKSETTKTQAAKLLEVICDQIDGALSFVVVMAVNIIEYSLLYDKIEEIQAKYEVLVDHAKSNFISSTHAEIRVESCLLVLSVMSYAISRRSDLMIMLEKLFIEYQEYFLEKSNSIIKARMCLLLPYYSETLFKDPKLTQHFKAHLGFLVQQTNPQENIASISFQAIDSLSIILEDEDNISRLKPLIIDIVEELIKYMPKVESNKFFDIVREVIRNYHEPLSQHDNILVKLVEALRDKCIQELDLIKQKKKTTKMGINKIWNSLRHLSETEAYIPKFQDQVEHALKPLFEYLSSDDDVPFDEDILEFMSNCIKISKKVTEVQWTVFTAFPNIFIKYKGLMGPLFTAINYVIIYGHEDIDKDQTIVEVLADMAMKGLEPEHDQSNDANSAEGALIIQLMFQYLGQIPYETWTKLLLSVIEFHHKQQANFLKARLGGVFCCSFLKDFETTQKILTENNKIHAALEITLGDPLVYEAHPYDRKVFIIGMSSIFIASNIGEVIQSIMTKILDTIISLLLYTMYLERRDEEKKKMQQVELDSDSDDDEDPEGRLNDRNVLVALINNTDPKVVTAEDVDNADDDDINEMFEFMNEEEKEANATMDFLVTKMKESDEFVIFRQVILKMKETNYDALKHLADQLPQTKRNEMRNILSTHRVQVGEGQNASHQARKVVSVKPGSGKINYNVLNNQNNNNGNNN